MRLSTDFNFPKLTDRQVAFSMIKTDPKLLEEAKRRNLYNSHDSPYVKLFSDLFYKGGKINYKADLDPEYKTTVTRYLKAMMLSFEPKHEEKEAICAMLLSELVEV